MLGKKIKSGMRIMAENIVRDNTNFQGRLAKKHLSAMNNPFFILKVLAEWGYEVEYYNQGHGIKGYRLNRKIRKAQGKLEHMDDEEVKKADYERKFIKIKTKTYNSLKKDEKILFSNHKSFEGCEILVARAICELRNELEINNLTITPIQAERPNGSNNWITIGYKLQRLSR